MSSRRIVLSTLGSLGDLHPVMGLALALQARGHAVLLATSEFYRQKIEAAGLPFSPLRPVMQPDDRQMLQRVLEPRRGPEYLIRTVLMPHLTQMYEDLSRIADGADFLISGEVVLAAPLVAEKKGIPWAAAILAPFSFFSAYDPPAFPFAPGTQLLTKAPVPVQRLLFEAAKLLMTRWGQPIAGLRRSLGLRASPHALIYDRYSPYLNLALFSSVLGKPQRDWPRNTVQTGFIFYDHHEGAAVEQLDDFLSFGTPPITFTLGSAAVLQAGSFYEESAEAARLLGRRALLLVGKNDPPENVSADMLVTEYASYSSVFARSAAIVHQGGVGTTAQALRAGAPQLVMPYAFDQPDNAARVSRMGVGLSIGRRRYRADRAATRLARLLENPAYAAEARAVERRISAEQGLATACDVVERTMRALCHSGA